MRSDSRREAVAHYGPGLFAVGNPGTLQTTAFVLRREQLEMERREARGVYFRLVKEPDAESKRIAFEQALNRRRAGQSDISYLRTINKVTSPPSHELPGFTGYGWA